MNYPLNSYELSEDGKRLLKWKGSETEIDMQADARLAVVESIDENAFRNNLNLQKLTLSQNITSVVITGCSKLSILNLSHCTQLTSMNLRSLWFITTLDLSSCSRLVNLELYNMENLAILDLSPCTQLTSLKMWYLYNLTTLDVTPCKRLTSLELGDLENLALIDSKGCTLLEEIKSSNVNLDNIFYLDYNPIWQKGSHKVDWKNAKNKIGNALQTVILPDGTIKKRSFLLF